LWQCGLSRDALQALGLALGADVPVFIFGQSAFAEGVGEKLRPVSLQPGWYVVLKPDVQVPTREIFCAEELTRDTKLIRIVDFSEGACHNDLEPVARLKYPEVDACVRWLSRFGDARMTGSGACVFARFDSEEEARLALHESVGKFDGFVAKGLDKHPLYSFAEV
jgi:4-diphosphocytidyl-2-C-methyl-D-erythritol kinase